MRNAKFHEVEVEDTAMGIIELSCGNPSDNQLNGSSKGTACLYNPLWGEGTAAYTGPNFPGVRFSGVCAYPVTRRKEEEFMR